MRAEEEEEEDGERDLAVQVLLQHLVDELLEELSALAEALRLVSELVPGVLPEGRDGDGGGERDTIGDERGAEHGEPRVASQQAPGLHLRAHRQLVELQRT